MKTPSLAEGTEWKNIFLLSYQYVRKKSMLICHRKYRFWGPCDPKSGYEIISICMYCVILLSLGGNNANTTTTRLIALQQKLYFRPE